MTADTDRDALLERLEAIDEEAMYQAPASTRAAIEQAMVALRQQAETIARLRSLVETAFEAGFRCGSNVTGWTAAEAWENSRARATLDEMGGGDG